MRRVPGRHVGRLTLRQYRRRVWGRGVVGVGLVLGSGAVWGPTVGCVVGAVGLGLVVGALALREARERQEVSEVFRLIRKEDRPDQL